MRELVPLSLIPALLGVAIPREDYDFWAKQFDRWGIALVSLLFFVVLAIVSWKRERAREKRQNAREDLQQTERADLLTKMVKSNEALVKLQIRSRYEMKKQTQSNEDMGRSIKELVRKVNCPASFHHKAPETTPPPQG